MKSPMNMAPFKLKSAPVNMNTPGSVAKLAGVSPMKNLTPEVNVSGGKKNVRTDVTKEYSTKGNKSTRDHIKKGGKVEKIPYGVTSQDLGTNNQNAGWMPPTTISPKTYKTRLTKAKKKAKSKKPATKRKTK